MSPTTERGSLFFKNLLATDIDLRNASFSYGGSEISSQVPLNAQAALPFWYTTLQTQFRELLPSLKNNIFKALDVANDSVRLSANGLTTNPFNIPYMQERGLI